LEGRVLKKLNPNYIPYQQSQTDYTSAIAVEDLRQEKFSLQEVLMNTRSGEESSLYKLSVDSNP